MLGIGCNYKNEFIDLFNGILIYVMNFRLGYYKVNDYLDVYKNYIVVFLV